MRHSTNFDASLNKIDLHSLTGPRHKMRRRPCLRWQLLVTLFLRPLVHLIPAQAFGPQLRLG